MLVTQINSRPTNSEQNHLFQSPFHSPTSLAFCESEVHTPSRKKKKKKKTEECINTTKREGEGGSQWSQSSCIQHFILCSYFILFFCLVTQYTDVLKGKKEEPHEINIPKEAVMCWCYSRILTFKSLKYSLQSRAYPTRNLSGTSKPKSERKTRS